MGDRPTLLKVLLLRRHWQRYETFCAEYDRAARLVEAGLERTWPSRAQYYRWLSARLKSGLPHPDSCRVLEKMFPGHTAKQLFAACPDQERNVEPLTAGTTRSPHDPPLLPVHSHPVLSGSSGENQQAHSTIGKPAAAEDSDEDEDVNRLAFIRTSLLAGVGAAVPNGVHTPDRRIRIDDVERYRRNLTYLYKLDDQHGGAATHDLALRTMRQLRHLCERGSYDSSTGRALHTITGQATEHAAWSAYDMKRHVEARHWWLEALHAARTADDEETTTIVLASMSLHAARSNRPREAIDLAQAAQRTARANSTPRLRAVLLSREALGHATNGSPQLASHAFARATSLLDQGPRDDDPAWVDFFGEADLSCHRTQAALDLRDSTEARNAAQRALDAADENSYPRNFALYSAQLATIMAHAGEADEAIPVATRAIVHAQQLGSARVTEEATNAVHAIARSGGGPDVRDFLDWSSNAIGYPV